MILIAFYVNYGHYVVANIVKYHSRTLCLEWYLF